MADQDVADRLDAAIDAALDATRTGQPVGGDDPALDAVLASLATLARPDAPAEVRARVDSAVRRPRSSGPWWWVRVAAALAALGFFAQGAVAVFASEWLADLLHAPHAPHVTREGGLAAFAIGALLALAVARPHLMESAMVAAVPLGLALGAYGASEIPHLENPAGEYFHLSQAAAALFLLVTWLVARRVDRDATAAPGEDQGR